MLSYFEALQELTKIYNTITLKNMMAIVMHIPGYHVPYTELHNLNQEHSCQCSYILC